MSITRVAKLAGVSSSTVSRVINNHPRVAPETADAVRKVMLKLGYMPSPNRPGPKPASRAKAATEVRRILVLGRSGVDGGNTPGFEQLMQGVSLAASRHNAELIFSHLPDEPELFRQRLAQLRIDAVFLSAALHPDARDQLAEYPCMVLMGNRRRPEFGDQVMQDAYSVGEMAARYLVERGHKRLAFLNLDSDHWAIHLYGHGFEFTARLLGAEVVAIETEKRQIGENWRDFAPETVDNMVKSYVALKDPPTGLFIAEDAQTALLQPALQRAGVTIGDATTSPNHNGTVEIVSCNNERPYLSGLDPIPATVDIRVNAIGERGLEQVMQRLNHPTTRLTDRAVILVQPKLVRPDGDSSPDSDATLA